MVNLSTNQELRRHLSVLPNIKEEKKFLKQSKPNKYNTGINNKYIDKVVDSVQIREDLIERLKSKKDKKIDHYIYSKYIKFLNKEKECYRKITEILY